MQPGVIIMGGLAVLERVGSAYSRTSATLCGRERQ